MSLPDLEAVAEACAAAGREILARPPGEAVVKADGSPQTAADVAAQDRLVPLLRRLAPGVPVVAEEGADDPAAIRGGRWWLVDPLDGTKEYLTGSGEYTVNAALVEDGVPVLGVVHAPALGTTWAAAGTTAWRADAAGRTGLRCRPRPAVPAVAASRRHARAALERFLAELGAHTLLDRGSSLKLCLVAEGGADLYPRPGRTMGWDIAAGHAVVLAAGGTVEIHGRTPLRYRPDDLANPPFLVVGDPSRPVPGIPETWPQE